MCIYNALRCGEISYRLDNKDEYRCFTSDNEASLWGNTHYKDWGQQHKRNTFLASNISSHITSRTGKKLFAYHASPIELYCGYLSASINGFLRETHSPKGDSLANNVTLLLAELCNAPRIPEDIIVFRMVCDSFANKLFYDNKHDLATYERGFLSTSLLDTIAINREHSHHHHLLKIYVPKGTVGVYVNPVTSRTEQEILIAPNRRLAMIDYPRKGEHGKYVTECMLINME